jgi:transposase-like protein
MTFLEFQKNFPTEKAVVNYFLKIRYPNGLTCNHCGSPKVYGRKDNLKLFDCGNCHNTFSPFKDTIFEKSCTDLRKWVYAIHIFLNGKKGISGYQLQREVGVTYKTAWRMLQQIRIAMGNKEQEQFIEAIVEIDETYVGGKPRKSNNRDDDLPKNKRGRGTKKAPVVGVIDRDNKKVYAKVSTTDAKGRKLTGKQLLNILNKVSKKGNKNTVIADEFRSYNFLEKKEFFSLRIDHQKMYADGIIHTNNIESFWAILKRGIYGIYHHVSVKYLQNYVNEFCFRYNNRQLNMFNMVLRQGIL